MKKVSKTLSVGWVLIWDALPALVTAVPWLVCLSVFGRARQDGTSKTPPAADRVQDRRWREEALPSAGTREAPPVGPERGTVGSPGLRPAPGRRGPAPPGGTRRPQATPRRVQGPVEGGRTPLPAPHRIKVHGGVNRLFGATGLPIGLNTSHARN